MTSIDNLAEEIMQGLQEYADLADTAMKKGCPEICHTSEKRNLRQCSEGHWKICKKLGNEKRLAKTVTLWR